MPSTAGLRCLHPRSRSAPDTDPATGRTYDDLLVIVTPSAQDKDALVGDESTPFFTVPHFDGYNAVLVQQSRLGELSYEELAEVVTDAWRSRAPARLRRAHARR